MVATLKEKSEAVRRALTEKNLIDTRIGAPAPDDLDQDALAEARTFAETAEDELSKRVIVAVASDRQLDAVVIYTSRAYTKADQKVIAAGIDESIPIIFRALDIGPQGPGSAAFQMLPKPALVNDRITCGTSISVANDRGAGTLGALVRNGNGALFGLSCGHVISGCGYLRTGMPILSPGVQDIVPNWPDPRVVGHFAQALPMVAGDPATIGVQPNLDAALFKIPDEDIVSSSQSGRYDTPTDIHDLDDDEDEGILEVEKVGRTTGYREGTVRTRFPHPIEIEFKFTCFPELGTVKKFEASVFTDNLWSVSSSGAPFAAPGDSGALVVSRPIGGESRKAIGIVVAGTKDGSAVMLPIRPVLEALQVTLVGSHGV